MLYTLVKYVRVSGLPEKWLISKRCSRLQKFLKHLSPSTLIVALKEPWKTCLPAMTYFQNYFLSFFLIGLQEKILEKSLTNRARKLRIALFWVLNTLAATTTFFSSFMFILICKICREKTDNLQEGKCNECYDTLMMVSEAGQWPNVVRTKAEGRSPRLPLKI